MEAFVLIFLFGILPMFGVITLCVWGCISTKNTPNNSTTTFTVDDGWVDVAKEREQKAEQSRKAFEQFHALLHSEYGLTLQQLRDICPTEDFIVIKREILALYNEGKLERKKDLAGVYHYRIKKEDAE